MQAVRKSEPNLLRRDACVFGSVSCSVDQSHSPMQIRSPSATSEAVPQLRQHESMPKAMRPKMRLSAKRTSLPQLVELSQKAVPVARGVSLLPRRLALRERLALYARWHRQGRAPSAESKASVARRWASWMAPWLGLRAQAGTERDSTRYPEKHRTHCARKPLTSRGLPAQLSSLRIWS